MTRFHQKAKDGVNWVQILVWVVAVNLLVWLILILTEGLVPFWVVYPSLLIIGLWMMLRRTITGALFLFGSAVFFLLVHLPFTLLAGSMGNPCPDCSRTLLWVTLFIVPFLTAFMAWMAWQQARRNEGKTP